MSDLMQQAVLRMPPELWRDDPIDVAQRHSHYVQAADELDQLRADARLMARALDQMISAKLPQRSEWLGISYAIARHLEEGR